MASSSDHMERSVNRLHYCRHSMGQVGGLCVRKMQNSKFPCKFNRKVLQKNAPGSLLFSRASSPAQVIRYHCSFDPDDKSSLVPTDLEALLESTLKKRRSNQAQSSTQRRGKKVLPKYNVISSTLKKQEKKSRIGKFQT